MRIITYCCCWLLCGWCINLYAQMRPLPAQLTWGPELRAPAGSHLIKIVDAGSWGAVALRYQQTSLWNKERYWWERYNDRFDLVHRVPLDHSQLELIDVIQWRGAYCDFYCETDKQSTDGKLYVRQRNDLGGIRAPARLLASLPVLEKGALARPSLRFSRDSSNLLIFYPLPTPADADERFLLRVLDDSLRLRWSREITTGYREDLLSLEDYQVTDDGRVVMLGRLYRSSVALQRRHGYPFLYVLLVYDEEGRFVGRHLFDVPGKHLAELSFQIKDERDIICAGLYTHSPKGELRGAAYFKLDIAQASLLDYNLNPFPLTARQALVKVVNEKTEEEASRQGYELQHIILRQDGGALLVAEEHRQDPYIQYFGPTTYERAFYQYNELLVVNISSSGHIEWMNVIPKQQETNNDEGRFSSFAMAVAPSRLFFLYNDHARNFSPRRKKQFKTNIGPESIVTLTELRTDNERSTFPIFVNRDADVITRPRLCRQVAGHLLMIYGENGQRYRFGKIAFNY